MFVFNKEAYKKDIVNWEEFTWTEVIDGNMLLPTADEDDMWTDGTYVVPEKWIKYV